MSLKKFPGYTSMWFEANPTDRSLDPGQDAFDEGMRIFQKKLTKDLAKKSKAQTTTSLDDVHETVEAAHAKYEDPGNQSKARERLRRFSGTLLYYGNIMDVLVQHHPEYVSLVWGAMKFLFVAFMNHEATISALAKGLCRIGDSLPRVQLAVVMYPTPTMKRAVAELYAYIIKFLIRAQDWHQENWIKHAWHSISRPVELRYNDLLAEIQMRSQMVHDLTIAGSQAEQRVMHQKLDEMSQKGIANETEMKQMKEILSTMHILLSSGFVQTNQLLLGGFSETNQRLSSGFIETNERLTDLQLSNILDFVASVPIPEPSKSLNWCLSMTRRRQLKQSFAPQEYHWLIPKLQDWSKASSSSLVMVRGGFQFRLDMKDLAAELAECLRNAGVQVIWILKTVDQMAEDPEQLSAVDILKYLTSQILRLPETKVTEAVMNLACVRIKSAETEDDWLLILGSVLANLNRVYIVLDIEVLNYDSSSVGADFWPREFVKIFQKLRERDLKTLVKVVLISYGSAVSFPGSTDMDWESYVSIVRAPVLQMKRFRNVRSSRGRISQFAMRGDQRRWTQRLEAHL